MTVTELDFLSHNGRDQIQAWIYEPIRPARAIVQIIHGLGEHSRRYLHMISSFLDAGFVVAADDHAGHGRTAMVSGVWGDTGPDGITTVVEDEATLAGLVREQHPDLPWFVFGHSWGSMIGRALAQTHGSEMAGLALCGVASQIRGFDELDRPALDARIAATADEDNGLARDDGTFTSQIFADFVSRYEDGASPNDWLATSPDVVRENASDPFNNLASPMSLRFMRDFIGLYDLVTARDFYPTVPTDLPVLLISGDADPVANYGEGTYHVANQLALTGHRDLRTRVWPGYRHEIHNEPDIRDDVEAEIVGFVDQHLI